ncbi:MAG: DUF6049 family protein [Mycobacteriales bacterium]
MLRLTTLRRRALGLGLVWALGVLTAAPVLAMETAPAPPAPVRPDSCASSSEEAPVHVEVTTLAPRAPSRPDEPFQVAGRLTNCGRQPLDRLEVRLAVGGKIDSRSGLARADEEPVLGDRRLPPGSAALEGLAPGEATTFDLRLLVRDLALGRENGVFPLAVQARARYGDAFRREPVGLASTFVPWFPDGPIAPTRIAWLVPLIDQPRRGPDGVLLDDKLDALLESNPDRAGRLYRVLASAREGAKGGCDPPAAPSGFASPAGSVGPPPEEPAEGVPVPSVTKCRGEPVPITYGVDPDLLSTVEAIASPYTVLERDGRVGRTASANAVQWLAAVRTAAGAGEVLALPYADPDVVALSRPESGVRDDVELLRKLGQAEARRLLGIEQLLTSIAWPPPSPIGGALDALVSGGEGAGRPAIVLDEDTFPEAPALLGRTPSTRTTLSSATGPVTALVVDSALSRLVEPDPSGAAWQGPRLAEQRWIAEAAVLAAERPSQSRTFLVAPRRTADLLPSVAGPAIADTGRLPWLCPVSLADVVAGTERCATLPDPQGPAQAEDRGTPVRRDSQDSELSAAFLERLAAVRRLSDQFTDEVLLAGGEQAKATKARLLRARGRAASSAWRDQPAAGRAMLDLLRDDVDGLRAQVRLVSEPVLLTGSTGTMRLTVENRLDQPVNVGVRLDATSEARLSSEETDVRQVPASQAIQLAVRVEARTSGRFVARARLIDVSGDPFGAPVELAVRSTQYGRVALAVTGVAAAVLLVAAGARIIRRAMGR